METDFATRLISELSQHQQPQTSIGPFLDVEGELVENKLDDKVANVEQHEPWPQVVAGLNDKEAIEYFMVTDPRLLGDVLRGNKIIYSKNNQFKPETKVRLVRRLLNKFRGLKYHRTYRSGDYKSLPVAQLHCPHIENCKSSYLMETEKQRSVDFKLSLLGAELGGGTTVTFSISRQVTAFGRCLTLAKECLYEIDEWMSDKGEVIRSLRIIDVRPGIQTLVLKAGVANHFCCNRHRDISRALKRFSHRLDYFKHCLPYSLSQGSEAEENFKIRTGHIIDAKGKLSDITGNFSVSALIKSTVMQEFQYNFTLHGGYDYIGFYRSEESASYMWAWTANSGVRDR